MPEFSDRLTIGPQSVTDDERTDEAMEETFPASDPPAHTGTTGPAGDSKPGAKPQSA